MSDHPDDKYRTFDRYEKLIAMTAIYPGRGDNIAYPTLGLNGEAGEVAEKVKKIMRDKGGIMTAEDKLEIAKELGDVLWYLTACATELDIPLATVAKMNTEKLLGRRERNTLSGSGDNR